MVRLRFAPSPTGYLHVGGLRTALFSYLYAKQQKGAFIFRLEDTDQQRFVEDSEKDLLAMLQWAGLEIDEGIEAGGAFGPYRQSERRAIYQEHAQQLLAAGHAYCCFCSPETLATLRQAQKAQGLAPRYDRRCRHLNTKTIQQNLAQGLPHVVRMKIPAHQTLTANDWIRGPLSVETDQLDDQVLLKADGFPTYHLAMVVDDHLMKITHVVRGEEWLPSFPKHHLLYEYFGWEPPHFIHLPLILNQNRAKLSKRQGDVAVEAYQKQGYLAEALVNFIALLGWNAGDDQEIFSLQALIEKFSFARLGKSPAVFDREKLDWMNQHYLHQLSQEDLFERLQPFIQQTPFAHQDPSRLKQVCGLLQPRLTTLADIQSKLALFFDENPVLEEAEWIEVLREDSSQVVLKAVKAHIATAEEMTESTFLHMMKAVQKATGIKGKPLWMPMRYALTLEAHGPELPAVAAVFGKEKCLRMIEQALRV